MRQPARLHIAPQKSIALRFIRRDDSPCAETVIFPHLDISATLPVGKPVTVQLPPLETGEYAVHCQMQVDKVWLEVKSVRPAQAYKP